MSRQSPQSLLQTARKPRDRFGTHSSAIARTWSESARLLPAHRHRVENTARKKASARHTRLRRPRESLPLNKSRTSTCAPTTSRARRREPRNLQVDYVDRLHVHWPVDTSRSPNDGRVAKAKRDGRRGMSASPTSTSRVESNAGLPETWSASRRSHPYIDQWKCSQRFLRWGLVLTA